MSRKRTRKAVFVRKTATKGYDLADALEKLTLRPKPVALPANITRFEQMGLKKDLLKGIYSQGYDKPAGCQTSVIPSLIEGRDAICQAQSGMGKTASFCISILQRLDLQNPDCKALVLAPTRELAEQILAEFRKFGQYMGVTCVRCIGGMDKLKDNLGKVNNGTWHIAVGTLGRLRNLFLKGFDGDLVKMFVIDEADKMIVDRSFRSDMKLVIRSIAWDAQVIITSATMPSGAMDLAKQFMRNPFTSLLKNDQLTLDGIKQFYVNVGNEAGKLLTMLELFPFLKEARGITFCNTRKGAELLAKQMAEKGHNISGMTGTMRQDARNNNLKNFRNGSIPTLVASDLLGRGVDIHHVQLVINYDLPKLNDEYIHRVGRAGRFGKKGVAISFVTDRELELGGIRQLETLYETTIPHLPPRIGDLMKQTLG